MHKHIFLIVLFAFVSQKLFAQLPAACNGTASAIACEITCISCNFNGFSGSTEGYPSGTAPEFCGTVENVQWLGFIAGATNATFTITPTNCLNGDGVQVALYTDCTLPPLACDKGEMGGGSLPVNITVPMTVGSNYYLLIDGYAGDQCQFTVKVDPPEAVFEPPLGVAGIVTGPAALCPNSTADFQVQPVSGASAYIWTGPPGTLFDSIPSPATIPASEGETVAVTLGNVPGNICVQAANACSSNPPCSASTFVDILDDSHRPKIQLDTVASLPCFDEPLSLFAKVLNTTTIRYNWTADSTGHLLSKPENATALVDSTGRYTVIVTDWSNGCTSSVSVDVTPQNIPSDAHIHVQHVRCFGERNGSVRVDSVLNGTPPFLYAFNNLPFGLDNAIMPIIAGDYHLVIQDVLGCEWDTIIQVIQPDELIVTLAPDTTISLGDMLVLWDSTAVLNPSRPVRWTLMVPADMGDTVSCAGCAAMPIRSFTYGLMVADSAGCTARDERSILVSPEHNVYFPNIFTPGSQESANDYFGPLGGKDMVSVPVFEVYDRWGHVMYQRNDLLKNDLSNFWDGQTNGKKAPPGVYVYRAEVLFKDGIREVYRGDITLIR